MTGSVTQTLTQSVKSTVRFSCKVKQWGGVKSLPGAGYFSYKTLTHEKENVFYNLTVSLRQRVFPQPLVDREGGN
jgi:hypothetical protein